MSNIDKQWLRQLAVDAKELAIIKRYTKGIEAQKKFIAAMTPALVLALLDELEAKDKLIDTLRQDKDKVIDMSKERISKLLACVAELEARTVNLPKRSVGEVMHLSGFSRDYAEGWCSGNDNAIHEIHAAGVKVAAAAGKGE